MRRAASETGWGWDGLRVRWAFDGYPPRVTGSGGTPMEAEFDTVAGWTEEVVVRLGPEYAIPAGCRGSASPAGLGWLIRTCGIGPGTRLVDVGGGVGGPAGYAVRHTGAAPVVVDPMLAACRAASRLFGIPAVAGTGERLPIADGAADAVWCLGVVCTVRDKRGLFREIHRVLRAGGPLGLLVVVGDEERPAGAPEGNTFPTDDGLRDLLRDSGFRIDAQTDLDDLPVPPADWAARTAEFDRALRADHGDDPRFVEAQDQSRRLSTLARDGHVVARLLHAVAR
ncbi:MAG: class I SAM-dependent methyltransferase [Pseudonocardia sp.]|nr:class I SAM-dependent methyltransferase [Pseudonocardia sp.]